MALRPENPANPTTDRDAAQQDGFLREVDEALREQEFIDLLRRYGKPVGGAILAVLLGFAGYLYWDHSRREASAELSEKAILALDKLDPRGGGLDQVLKEIDPLTKQGSPAAQANARLLRAAISFQQGKQEDAAREFAAVAADTAAPQAFRDMGLIRETAIRFDQLAPQQVVDRLKPLAVPGNPWFGSAGEMVGMAYLKLGKTDLAGAMFVAVAKDNDVPQSLRTRMRQIAGQLGFDAGEDPAAANTPAMNR